MSVKLGTIALTSRMILGLAAASNDSSLTVNIVFSFGFSYIPSSLEFKKNEAGIERRNPPLQPPRQEPQLGPQPGLLQALQFLVYLAVTKTGSGEYRGATMVLLENFTFSIVTRSAACRRVRPEMSSTILLSFGSAEADDGGGGVAEDEGAAAAVARHLDGLVNVL